MTFNINAAFAVLLGLSLVGIAHADFVDSDFSSDSITFNDVNVNDIGNGWHGRNNSYAVAGGILTQTNSGGSGTRFGQAIDASGLTGTGWMAEIDVAGLDLSGTDPRVQIYAGKLQAGVSGGAVLLTVGNNTGDNVQIGTGIVDGDAFDYLYDDTFDTTGLIPIDFTSADLTPYDVLMIRVNSTGNQTDDFMVDAIRLFNVNAGAPVPEPTTLALLIVGLIGLVARRRRRRR
jgi:hypothetical protein